MLAELGFEGMTVDLVAARAGAARATVYRRWPTKVELVLGAVRRLGPDGVDPGQLPDTGSLRGDLLAASRPEADGDQQRRIRVVAGLHALAGREPRIAALLNEGGIDPWIEVNRVLITRAVQRGEFGPVHVDTLAQVVPAMCTCRVAVQGLPVTPAYATALIDHVLLPAMRGAHPADAAGPHTQPPNRRGRTP